MSTSVLVTVPWWRALAERLGRNAIVVASPYLAAVVAAGGGVDVVTVAVGIGGAVLVSLVKAVLMALAGVTVTEGTALGWQFLDRAVPAAAGVLLGLWPADLAELAEVDLRAALVAAGAAAVLAVVGYKVTPPAFQVRARHARTAGGEAGGVHLGVLVAAVAAIWVVAVLVVAWSASGAAARPGVRPVAVPSVRAWSASTCQGLLTVRHSAEVAVLDGQRVDLVRVNEDARYAHDGSTSARWAWMFRKPSGPVVVELHHVGNGAGEGGSWDPVPVGAYLRQVESEATVRLNGQPTYDAARVVLTVDGVGAVASSGVPITSRCPA